MFDIEIALDSLQKIKAMLDLITERFSVGQSPNYFLFAAVGMMRLNSICMKLIALVETVNGLYNKTNHELLKDYPEVYWKGVMGIRDKISHHYFEIDPEVVFRTIEEDIPSMIPVVERMISDLSKK